MVVKVNLVLRRHRNCCIRYATRARLLPGHAGAPFGASTGRGARSGWELVEFAQTDGPAGGPSLDDAAGTEV